MPSPSRLEGLPCSGCPWCHILLPAVSERCCVQFPVVVLELLHRVEGRSSYCREEALLHPGPVLLPYHLVVLVLPKREVAQTASHATSCDERILAENLLLFSGSLGIHPSTGAPQKVYLVVFYPRRRRTSQLPEWWCNTIETAEIRNCFRANCCHRL